MQSLLKFVFLHNRGCYVFIQKMFLRIDTKYYIWMSSQLGCGVKTNLIILEVSTFT